ncbi:mechanosensitive ion channel domain-containing protein [Dasania marina]|uniref:mechanosensitive ion channel family protein n=1 Tax=Dasania marina TaxID=471499 RepID=UPI0030D8D0D8
MNYAIDHIASLPLALRLTSFIGLAVITHLFVIVIRHFANYILARKPSKQYQKLGSLFTLTTSCIIFALYFFSVGFIFQEFGISLSAYLASATIVGLAIGFGLQGVVQDVVTGLTFIFSDLIDVGDLVEISSQTGVVKAITMRFIELENAMGAVVFIPNRTINNIINYPRGYVRCIVDVTLRGDEEQKQQIENIASQLTLTIHQQFPGILIAKPSVEGRITLNPSKEILRIKFRIWPNRGQPIETTFFQELTAKLQNIDPDYKQWMIAISYEVEEKKTVKYKALPWR